jgi:zinc transporter
MTDLRLAAANEAAAIPGLVWAFRFDRDGSAEMLPIDRPVDLDSDADSWYWLHFNLVDQRSRHWLATAPGLSAAARDLLLKSDEHPQLQLCDTCVSGVLIDTVHELGRVTDQICQLRFAMTERFVLSGRRRPLHAVEQTKVAIGDGRTVPVPSALLETLIEHMAAEYERLVHELSEAMDRVEDHVLAEAVYDERAQLSRLRRRAARGHRRLSALSSQFHRLEYQIEGDRRAGLRVAAGRMAQRLAALDHEVMAMQERGRLLQEEIAAKLAEETNRHLHALSILTSVFLPPTLVVGIFGMNTKGLPLSDNDDGFLWGLALCLASAAAVYLLLKRVSNFLKKRGVVK